MPRLPSRALPAKPIPEAERPLADYFPVSRKQLSNFMQAWTKKEKHEEGPVRSPQSKGRGSSRPE